MKRYLVAGSGISGIGAVKLLGRNASDITLYDGNEALTEEEIRARLDGNKDVKIVIGELPQEVIDAVDIMVISPGIPIDSEIVTRVRDCGVEIWGEIELAYRYSKGRVIGITGTNGKTTTTTLTGEIMKNHFESVFVVGNIGTAYTSVASDTGLDTVTVAEISSFQLESVQKFKPVVSAVLNITPDHLNRHYTMENYTAVKMSIARNQEEHQVCVLNYEDDILRREAEKLKNRVLYFSSRRVLPEGICLNGGNIVYREHGTETFICGAHEMKLVGIHNIENVMAAAAIAMVMKVPAEIIRETIRNFNAVEHRIEYVAEKQGVIYYNDSKGTNTDASIKAIEAMTRPTVLIAGGYDKGSEYDEWLEAFRGKIRHLVLLGATRDKIAETADRHGYKDYTCVDSLEEAVAVSAERAGEGYAVLLSPACASWDMFKSYEERGRLFKKYVNSL